MPAKKMVLKIMAVLIVTPSLSFAGGGLGGYNSGFHPDPTAAQLEPVSSNIPGNETETAGSLLIDQSATMENRLKRLGFLACSFLNPDTPVPQQIPDGGQLFFAWQYWMTWKLGERTAGISSTEVNARKDQMIANLQAQYGEFKITSEMRRDLEYMARRDIATENMIEQIKAETKKDSVSPDDIIHYLAQKYTEKDLVELESLFKFFHAVSAPLSGLLGSGIYAFYATDAGFITGTVLALKKEFEKKFGKDFIITGLPDDPITRAINEEFNILTALKTPVENLLGRKLDFFNPNGKDTGFLASWAREVNGGLKEGDYTLTQVIDKIKLEKRLLFLLERTAGHRFFDLTTKGSEDANFLYFHEGRILKALDLKKYGQSVKPEDFIKTLQWGSFPTIGNMGIKLTAQPLNFLVTRGEFNKEISEPTTLDIAFGDWSFMNQLVFNAKTVSGNGEFEVRIMNAEGEEAVFKVKGLQNDSDGSKVIIPIWGPSDIAGGDNSQLPDYVSNSTWNEWLEQSLWKNENGEKVLIPNSKECKIVKVKDEITDWRHIANMQIIPLDSVLDINGIKSLTNYQVSSSQVVSELKKGNNILIKAKQGAVINKPGVGNHPLWWNPGFKNLNVGGENMLIVGWLPAKGLMYHERVQFVIPKYSNNILTMDYDKFLQEVWDGGPIYVVKGEGL